MLPVDTTEVPIVSSSGQLAGPFPMETVGSDSLLTILAFLDVVSVVRFQKTAKQFRFPWCFREYVWRLLVLRRWNVGSESLFLRRCGVAHWQNAYETLHLRGKHPRGVFFEKNSNVFARGGVGGVFCWLSLAHTADNRIRRGRVKLRLCVQNILNDRATILLHDLLVAVKCHIEEFSFESTYTTELLEAEANDCKLLARDGVRSEPPETDISMVTLRGSEFVVIEASVSCPRDMISEVDFLTRAESVSFTVEGSNFVWSQGREVPTRHRLKTKFDDEHVILDQFTQLPGGVALLSSNPIDLF